MPKIINVPIEPLEERYSAQWNRWIPEDFKRLGVDFIHLNWVNPLSSTVRQGSFLDVIGTNFYKASQLQQLMIMFEQGEITHGDVFLLNDIWFPGIEMLAYIRDALHIDFKIAGIAHAGTWDPWDFLTQKDMDLWARDLENSWFRIVDFVLVNSRFHAELLEDTREINPEKIFVVGYPFKPEEFVIPDYPKENIVVFPHRLNPEKQPEVFDALKEMLQPKFPDWQFIKTKDVWTDKKAYYELLNRSKIAFSCALQETFGIAMVESVMCGCVPLVPDRLSYLHLYHTDFRYEYETDCYEKLSYMMKDLQSFEEKRKLQMEYFISESSLFTKRVVDIVFDNYKFNYPDQWEPYYGQRFF